MNLHVRKVLSVRHVHAVLLIGFLALCQPLRADFGMDSATPGVPELRIVGWTIDDSLAGNGDGGLHPGETALLQIYLSNFGNETARSVAGTLNEVTDHPDVEILDKVATWPDLAGNGIPGSSAMPHFRIQVAATRPCHWEIPLRLDLVAEGGYFESREFTLRLVDPQVRDLEKEIARPFVYGGAAGDDTGASTAMGDIDGDGYDDLIVGNPLSDSLGGATTDAGTVAVYYGQPTPRTDDDLATIGPDRFLIYHNNSFDRFGTSVASGDLNGDGFDEIIGGVPQFMVTVSNQGAVFIIEGQASRRSDIDLAGFGSLIYVYGDDAEDFAGNSVAAGDFNRDGFDDLVIGVFQGDGPSNGRSNAGEVTIVYGGPEGTGSGGLGYSGPGITNIFGAQVNDRLGSTLAVGDFDGDGFDDLLIGSDSAYSGTGPLRFDGGIGVVVYGGPGSLSDIDLASPPAGGVTRVFGAESYDNCGFSIAAGDLDGDGRDDMLLGCAGADGPANARANAGESVIVYGEAGRPAIIDLASPPDTVRFVYGADDFDYNGSYVHAADLDGDGYDEALFASPLGDGPGNTRADGGDIAIVPGGPDRLPDLDLATPPPGVTFVYGGDLDNLPHANILATTLIYGNRPMSSGDLDGDGFQDLAIGNGLGDGPENARLDGGQVAILRGAPRSRYRHDSDPFAFIDATIGTDLGLGCDDCSATIPIGFEFDYFGRKYDTVTVGSNGYLTFGGDGDLPLPFCPPNSATPNNVVAVLWDDWNPAAGGAVHSLLEGTAPNRRLTIEWAAVPLFPAIGDATFEVTLFETSDQILMQYQDVVVGNGFSDYGGTAVAGLENALGLNGVPASCFNGTVADGSARRYRRFAAPTTFYSTDVEPVAPGWNAFPVTGSVLWHNGAEPACTPVARSGSGSLYYGQDSSCDYDTPGFANSSVARSPILLDFPQDASLTFWHRRDTEDFLGYDTSTVEAQGDGGGFVTLAQVVDDRNAWAFSDDFLSADPLNGLFAPIDLSSYAGQDFEMQFRFDTVDDANNFYFGWAVDDIEIRACPVYGAGGAAAAAEARATAEPDTICETAPGMVDAIGSYCASCGAGLTYQWREAGVPIAGATGIGYSIPAGHMPGMFDYTVEIACPSSAACADESDPAPVTVVQAPVEVGPTLTAGLDVSGSSVTFNWTDVPGADDYVLFSSTDPSVMFTNVVGSTASGASGVSDPVAGPSLVFYLVAGRNPVCGVGPQRAP